MFPKLIFHTLLLGERLSVSINFFKSVNILKYFWYTCGWLCVHGLYKFNFALYHLFCHSLSFSFTWSCANTYVYFYRWHDYNPQIITIWLEKLLKIMIYLLVIRILVISTRYSFDLFLWLYYSLKNKYLSGLVNIARSVYDDNFKDFIVSSFTKKCCIHFVISLYLMCLWSYESV